MEKWKTLSTKMVFDHKWFKVRQDTVQLPNGKIIDDYLLALGGGVAIIVPVTKDKKFVLVKQYKHAAGELMIEYPAGLVNTNETPSEAAIRELTEETGYTARVITQIGKIANNPTKNVSTTYIFLAEDVEKTDKVAFDDNEEIETLVKSHSEVLELIRHGTIWASGSVAATFIAFDQLQLLKPSSSM